MDTEVATNIDADVFMPSKKSQLKAGKKRTISSTASGHGNDDQQMQVDEATGIEGSRKSSAPKNKRKKHTSVELRKIAVPSHRLVFEIANCEKINSSCRIMKTLHLQILTVKR